MMGGKLRMYNVEFGDAFLLYGEDENLVVDLGSIQENFDCNPVRDSICKESAGRQLSLMLTHFHRDHWSGLQNQSVGHSLPSLKMVYLPDIFQMRVYGRLDVIVRSLLSDFLEAVVLQRDPQFTLADLLRQVLPGLHKEKMCFLNRGDIFHVGGKSYEVLWPRLDYKDIIFKPEKALREFLEQVEDKLAINGAEVKLWDTIDAIADVLLRDFASRLEYPISAFVRAEQRTYEDLYKRAQKLSEILASEVQREEKEFRQKIIYYAKRLGADWNRVSLIFQEVETENNQGVLMTGDIQKSVLTKLVKGSFGTPKLRESYTVIKVPHHGTRTHFCDILPRSRYLCISNGEGNNNYKKISEQYECVYGCEGKKADIICTNPRCEFIDWKGYCPKKNPTKSFYEISW